MTDEQKKASKEAMDKARADGKRGKEVWDAGQAAVKLTPEQKTKMDEAKKASEALDKELREKVDAFLTQEQKDQLKKMREEMRKRMGGSQLDAAWAKPLRRRGQSNRTRVDLAIEVGPRAFLGPCETPYGMAAK